MHGKADTMMTPQQADAIAEQLLDAERGQPPASVEIAHERNMVWLPMILLVVPLLRSLEKQANAATLALTALVCGVAALLVFLQRRRGPLIKVDGVAIACSVLWRQHRLPLGAVERVRFHQALRGWQLRHRLDIDAGGRQVTVWIPRQKIVPVYQLRHLLRVLLQDKYSESQR